MKHSITIQPNAERGYDALVSVALPRYMADEGPAIVHSVNAPSESAARTLAQAWIDAQPKQKRTRRARPLSEGELESIEAARNEDPD